MRDNTLAEPWLVEAVAQGGDGLKVQQTQVGADGRGRSSLPDAGKYSDVTLIVSAMAPVTTEPATIHYNIASP